MTGQTTHLGLPQWQEDDYVLMEEFNAAFAALDDYVDTVNEQIEEAGNALAQQIDTVNHNFVRSWIAQQLTNPVLGTTPTAAFVQHVVASYALAHGTGFPKSNENRICGVVNDQSGRPCIGVGSGRDSQNPQPDSYSFTLAVPVPLDKTYHHLTAALYFRGSEPDTITNLHPASLDGVPFKSAFNITGAAVSCTVSGAETEREGRIMDVWPIPVVRHNSVSGNDETYQLEMAEEIFHAHGEFSDSVTVTFSAQCASGLTLRPYTVVVLMS